MALSPHRRLVLTTTSDGGRTVVAAAGELDLSTVAELLGAGRDALAGGALVLDLGELRFMDSSGVRALDALMREAAQRGASLSIRPQLQDGVVTVLRITGMVDVLPIEKETS